MFLLFAVATPCILAQTNTSTNALPALAPPLPELPPTFWEQYGVAIVMVAPVILALAAIVVWQTIKSKSQPVLPPEIVAREALARLQGRAEDGKNISEVSQILRRFISVVFQFPPAELTTAEFSAALAGNAKIGPELTQAISTFLRECDERKFSQAGSSAPLNITARALEMVQMVERASSRAETKDGGSSGASPHQTAK
jgi:hypothetical protein